MARVTEPVDEAGTEVEVSEGRSATDVNALVSGIGGGAGLAGYSSIKGDDFDTRIAITKAITSSEPVDDHKNEVINLAHVIIQVVQFASEKSGEVEDAARVTLIDDAGKAYHATSIGLLQSVRTMIATLGEPDAWPHAVPVTIVEKRGRSGYKYFTIEF